MEQKPNRPTPPRRPLTEEERRRLAERRRQAAMHNPPPRGNARPTQPPKPPTHHPHPQRKQPNVLYKVVDYVDDHAVRVKRIASVVLVVLALILIPVIVLAILNGGDEPPVDTSDYVLTIGEQTLTIPYAEAVIDGQVYLNVYDLCDYCHLTVSGSPDALKFAIDDTRFLVLYRDSREISVNGVRAELNEPALFTEDKVLLPLEVLQSTITGLAITPAAESHEITLIRSDEPLGFTADTATLSVDGVPTTVTFSSALGAYERFMNPPGSDYLLLINKTHPIGEDFAPTDLAAMPLDYATKELELRQNAAGALEAMFVEMYAAGFTDIKVTSAYRSYSYQSSLFNTYVSDEMAKDPKLSLKEAEAIVATYSALPGTSEHHSGLCLDLINQKTMTLDETFADEPVYAWLCENAWKFGFILRYPEDKTEITGYTYEPWHYRYVGRYHAAQIHAKGLCLEEYLQSIQ